MKTPATLDRAGIAARIPHAGRMCLLDAMLHWDRERIACETDSHRAADNPLRSRSGLQAACAIEYAAQAMALHGALVAPVGAGPQAGYLASVRGVKLAVARLDELPGPLQVRAQRLAGDERQVMYAFELDCAPLGRIAEGRATVVLNTPLPAASTEARA